MNIRVPQWLPTFTLAMLAPLAAAAADAPEAVTPAPVAAATQVAVYSFNDLGLGRPADLRGVDGGIFLPFGVRRDQTVVSARVSLRYSYSPALLPQVSHLRLLLNGEPMATLPVPKEGAGREQTAEVALDPRYFTDYNRLGVQLIGHYTEDCEDPLHSSLWATVSDQSSIELTLRPLPLADDLALLPLPFFDPRDGRRLELPFVLPASPSLELLRQAGVVASWFGAMADYRSARFPVRYDELPRQHAVVFMTDAEKPKGLELPASPVPAIALLPHPADPAIKLLVIHAHDAAGLKTAVDALTLGYTTFSGSTVGVRTPVTLQPRKPYDAPNWMRMDQPVRFGELVRQASDLEVSGATPPAVVINARLPPDLLTWNQGGVPVDLKYRYTPPLENDNSLLTVDINDQFLQSFRLRPQAGTLLGKLPKLGGMLQARDDLTIPSFRIIGDNQLKFHFNLDPHREGLCRNAPGNALRAAIDPDSTIDLSAFPHYAAMPDLALFANGGYPFSRYADLAETAVVMPDGPSAAQTETMLFALGRIGRITGVPASAVRLIGDSQIERAGDVDLLLIDTAALLQKWQGDTPTLIERGHREISLGNLTRWMPLPFDLATGRPDTVGAQDIAVDSSGALAALAGFRSPLHGGRSVVAFSASQPEALGLLLDALENGGTVRQIRGDLTLLRDGQIESLQTGAERYFVGHLPLRAWLWFHLSRHPLLLVLSGLLAAVLIGLGVYALLGKLAARRLAH